MSRRLLIAGFVLCALSLLVPPLGLGALIIGIIALVRGRIGPGATLVVIGTVLPFAGTIILQAFFLKPYRIPCSAMVPTLEVGDRILVNPGGGDPKTGDIVVFSPAGGRSGAAAVRRAAPVDAGVPAPDQQSG